MRFFQSILKIILLIGFTTWLVACGGGESETPFGGGGGGSTNASPGGIYSGTIFLNGAQRTDPIVGVVTESGHGYFLDTYDGGVYEIQFTVNGNSSTGSFNAYLSGNEPYRSFPNGTIRDFGTQTSTIVERQSISGTYNTPTDAGSFFLTNQPAHYELGSSFASIHGGYSGKGSYRITPDLPIMKVNHSITLSIGGPDFQAKDSRCVFTGQISIIDINYNVYRVGGIGSCAQNSSATGFMGLGFLTPKSGTTPAVFTLIAPAGGDYYAAIASCDFCLSSRRPWELRTE